MNTLGKGPVPMTTSTIVTAVEQLRIGELVILPTDTVYGICADVENDAAVQALYAAKGKSFDTPLQLIFDSLSSGRTEINFNSVPIGCY